MQRFPFVPQVTSFHCHSMLSEFHGIISQTSQNRHQHVLNLPRMIIVFLTQILSSSSSLNSIHWKIELIQEREEFLRESEKSIIITAFNGWIGTIMLLLHTLKMKLSTRVWAWPVNERSFVQHRSWAHPLPWHLWAIDNGWSTWSLNLITIIVPREWFTVKLSLYKSRHKARDDGHQWHIY